MGAYARNALAAPRGFAKSTVVATEVPLFLLLTKPFYTIALGLSTDRLVEGRFDKIIQQLTDNPLIIDDFGKMKPKRGDAIWNRHNIQLANHASMEGYSVTGRKRGARPRLFLLDDPEYDPDSDSEQAKQLLLEKFETYLFRQIIPMLEKGSSIFWIGTMISHKCFLYHACCEDDDRFEYWNRRVLKAIYKNEDSKTGSSLLWGDKWDEDFLITRRAEIGESAFAAEYQGEPGSAQDRILVVNPLYNEYSIPSNVRSDSDYYTNPLLSNTPITYNTRTKPSSELYSLWEEDPESVDLKTTKKEIRAKDLFSKMFRIITVDYAYTLSAYSDYSCVGCFGYDSNNILWILDMWMGRVRDPQLMAQIYKMGRKWMPKIIGIEASGMQISLIETADDYIRELNYGSNDWIPRVLPIRYPPHVSKADRIAQLEWRYQAGRIMYPAHLKKKWPINALYSQTADFTKDLGLLRFDDAIDTVSMTQYLVHNRGSQGTFYDTVDKSLADRIRNNDPLVPGIPILSGIDTQRITPEIMAAILDTARKKSNNIARPENKLFRGCSGRF